MRNLARECGSEARLVLAVGAAKKGDFAAAKRHVSTVPETGANRLLKPGFAAWIEFGLGDPNKAFEALRSLAGVEGLRVFLELHVALINDAAGRSAQAETAFRSAIGNGNSAPLRLTQAFAGFLARNNKRPEAIALWDKFLAASPESSVADIARQRLIEGKTPPRLATKAPERVDGLVMIGPSLPIAPPVPERASIDANFYEPYPADVSGWGKYNLAYWHDHYPDFVEFFFTGCFSEPHSTKPIEDSVGWALETTPSVLEAEAVPKSKKLIRLRIDAGSEERTLVAGIAEGYTPDQLVGRTVVIVANLKPAKLMGIESNGMVLAASPEGGAPILLSVDERIPPGTRVR